MKKEITESDYKNAIALIEAFKAQKEAPVPMNGIDYSKLKEATERYIELLKKGKIGNDDFKEEIFVTALEAVFGNDVWDWVRANIKIDSKQIIPGSHLRNYLGDK